jgi:hypothetical protein
VLTPIQSGFRGRQAQVPASPHDAATLGRGPVTPAARFEVSHALHDASALVLLVLRLNIGVAKAHALLDHADPRLGNTLKSPDVVSLWFMHLQHHRGARLQPGTDECRQSRVGEGGRVSRECTARCWRASSNPDGVLCRPGLSSQEQGDGGVCEAPRFLQRRAGQGISALTHQNNGAPTRSRQRATKRAAISSSVILSW